MWLGGLASAGVVVSHHLAYWAAAPDPHERAELLRAGGHEHWSYVVALAVGLLVPCLAGFVRTGLRGPLRLGPCRSLALRLALLQGVAFVALETVERILVGSGVADLASEPVIVVGVMVQGLVAALGAALISLLGRALATWRTRRAGFPKAQRAIVPRSRSLVPPRFPAATGAGALRGPPPALT
jgi:hypothetical protein